LSIIYDALKKVEKSFHKTNTETKKVPSGREGQNKTKAKPVLIYILVALIVLFFGKNISGLFSKAKNKAIPPATLPIESPVNTTPGQGADPESSQEAIQPPAEPTLTLNGVYCQGKDSYALINNRIAKIGDSVQGAQVKEITLDRVTLEFEGRTITLNSSH